jgi:hypothetical protein
LIVIGGHAPTIVIMNDCEPVQVLPSVAVTVNWKVLATVGVPESTPADDSVRPSGKEPAVTAKVYGPEPPDAEKVAPE